MKQNNTATAQTAQHTPGPWKVAKGDNGAKTDKLVFADTAIIADCENQLFHPATQEANARLIAAAPELLATLVALLDGVDDLHISLTDSTTQGKFKAARAAIAKATA